MKHTLGRRASFWVSAAVVCHTLWTSAAPAMTYPLYASEWHLTPAVTTSVFALYPIMVVAVLTGFGDISDYIGRRVTMLAGLAASLLGVLAFAVAPDVVWLFVGRALMGIGVGLSAGPSAAALVDFSAPGQSRRASSIATAAQALGIASATLIGGGLIQYAPLPTRLNFCVLFLVLAAIFAATWFLPRHAAAGSAGRWRMKVPTIPRRLRGIFVASSVAVTGGYTLGALMLSLGAQIAHDLIGSGDALVNGAAIALFAVVSGVCGILTRQLPSRPAMMLGGAAAVLSMAFLALSASDHRLAVFLAATALTGVGFSLMFSGGLSLINANAPARHRGGTLSAVFLVAYLIQSIVPLLLGTAATAWGLKVAIDLGAVTIALMGLGTIALAARARPAQSPIDLVSPSPNEGARSHVA